MGPVTRPELSERQWQDQVVELAQLYRWRIHHCRAALNQRGQYSTPIQGDPGFPDLVLVRDYRCLLVELKANTGKLASEQRDWLRALAQAGIDARVWQPRDWPEVQRELTWRPASELSVEGVRTGGRT